MTAYVNVTATFPKGYTRRVQYNPRTGHAQFSMWRDGRTNYVPGHFDKKTRTFTPRRKKDLRGYSPVRG